MKSLERVHGTTGIKIIIGSAFFWAWLDALFMSMFFVRPEAEGFMAEMATIAVFGLSLPWLALSLAKPAACNGLLAKKRVPLAFAALGTAGSLLLLLAGINLNWIALVAGGTCAGAFMAAYQLAWGAAYCHDGERSATPYVAGGFACAIVVDAPLLFMIPEAAAVFSALLPLVSGALFASIDPQLRTYRRTAPVDPLPKRSVRSRLKAHLGTSMMLLCAVALVMTGFGYLQHLVSFSPIASDGYPNGILVQVARGVTAVLVFAIVVLGRRRASAVYRVGLLAMIAGFMLMAFLFGTNLFWVSGAIIISGYTILDLLIWVAFSQIAYAQSRDPLKTIALMRLLAVLCYPVGAVAGIMLVGNGETMHGNVAAETTVVGYLVVIATVLLLSSEDMWMLTGRQQPSLSGDDRATQEERIDAWFYSIGLTAREREIGLLLAYGRTQPWIAERLSISENTVGTHVRHIYQKADVHDRQQFIDSVLSPDQTASPEPRDQAR